MRYDVVVIGGGFYGSMLALFLSEYYDRVALLEQHSTLLSMASYINQARVHNGYHYPRSLMSAISSFRNFPRFCLDFRHAIVSDFDKYYGIARSGTKVGAREFYKRFHTIGASIEIASQEVKGLFNTALVDEVYKV